MNYHTARAVAPFTTCYYNVCMSSSDETSMSEHSESSLGTNAEFGAIKSSGEDSKSVP